MKKYLFLFSLFCSICAVSGADLIFEITKQGTISFPQGQLLGFRGIGLDRFVGYSFNGKDSLLWFETLRQDQAQKNFTLSLNAAVHALPPKPEFMVLFFRPGFHNYLAVDFTGKAVFSTWYKAMNGKTLQLKISSTKAVRVGKGRLTRFAVTAETLGNNQLRAKLWINGECVAQKSVQGKEFITYRKNIYIGSAPDYIKKIATFQGVIQAVQLYNGILPDKEVIALR